MLEVEEWELTAAPSKYENRVLSNGEIFMSMFDVYVSV